MRVLIATEVESKENRQSVRHNNIVSHVAEIQARLLVFGSRPGDYLPQKGRHVMVSGARPWRA